MSETDNVLPRALSTYLWYSKWDYRPAVSSLLTAYELKNYSLCSRPTRSASAFMRLSRA